MKTNAVNILVGTIDVDDNLIEATFDGSHQTLKCRTNRKSDFRYNEDTETVYWHEEHPRHYEELVDDYILEKLELKVKKHITLDGVKGNSIAYTHLWNAAHGLDQSEDAH